MLLLPSILIALVFFFEGAIFVILAYASATVTSLFFQNYSLGQYGLIFFPLALGGLFSSLWIGKMAMKKGLHFCFSIGILSHLLSLFFVGAILLSITYPLYNIIFFSTSILFLGAATGIMHTVLNSLIAYHFPSKTEVAVTAFYIAVGVGAFVGSFLLGKNFAIYILIFIVLLFTIFFLYDLFMDYPPIEPVTEKKALTGLWLLLAAIFFWGIYEQLVYDWSVLFLLKEHGFSNTAAEWGHRALVIFFTISRIAFALILLVLSLRTVLFIAPLFLFLFSLGGYLAFDKFNAYFLFSGIGFFYSSILPLALSFAIKYFPEQKPVAIGRIIGTFLAGFGLGSLTFGQLQAFGWLRLSDLFLLAAIIAFFVFFFISLTLLRKKPSLET